MKTDGIEDLANALIANHGVKALEVAINARHESVIGSSSHFMWASVIVKLKEKRDSGLFT